MLTPVNRPRDAIHGQPAPAPMAIQPHHPIQPHQPSQPHHMAATPHLLDSASPARCPTCRGLPFPRLDCIEKKKNPTKPMSLVFLFGVVWSTVSLLGLGACFDLFPSHYEAGTHTHKPNRGRAKPTPNQIRLTQSHSGSGAGSGSGLFFGRTDGQAGRPQTSDT